MSNYPPNPPKYPQMAPPPEFYRQPPPAPKGPREYSILSALVLAPFFHAGLSRDVARNWRGIGFWYLFLLLLITWIVIMVKVHVSVAAFVRNDFPQVVKDVPPITINNGHVTSPVDQPYFIKDPGSGKNIAVLDTTGTINSMDDTDAFVLVTDNKLFIRQQNNNEIKQEDLSKIKYFYIDKAKITGWVDLFSKWIAIALLPMVLIGALIGRLIQALIYGGINMAFSSAFSANLDYAAAMRLAVIAVTPVIYLDTILWLGGWSIPMSKLLGIGIALVYMAVAVRANANPNPPPPAGGFPVMYPPPG